MEFEFLEPGDLMDGELRLKMLSAEVDSKGEEPLPTYRFQMENSSTQESIGFINLRIGFGSNIVLYRGHFGYGVEGAFRGKGYAERACRLLIPLAHRHGLDPIWITCNPDNIASRRTCEKLGAELVETITVPEGTEAYGAGARVKCRYRLI